MQISAGAEYLASIFGTEKDKVNCSFYFKIGACRHGDKCSRIHNKPTFSQTLLLKNLYKNPKLDWSGNQFERNGGISEADEQRHFDDVFEEIFTEIEDRYGEIQEMNVCDNIGEHMVGNVYIKFRREADAEEAEKALNDRWFGGEPIYAELSPVTDFRDACCRQYEMGECMRGGFCNFMHLKPISYELRRELYNRGKKKVKKKGRKRRKQPLPSAYLCNSPSSSDDSSLVTNNSSRSPSLPAAFRTTYSSDDYSSDDVDKSRILGQRKTTKLRNILRTLGSLD